jgi:selenocysteine lyase/cysteine desulfurase
MTSRLRISLGWLNNIQDIEALIAFLKVFLDNDSDQFTAFYDRQFQ